MRRIFSVAAIVSVLAHRASAQADSMRVRPISVWATLSAGPGYSSNNDRALVGLNLGAFASYGSWMAGYRRGGAGGLETDGSWDDAVLVGKRFLGTNSTTFVAIGPANVHNDVTGQGHLGIGVLAEGGLNARVIGLGVSAFGGWSPAVSYIGIGLTLDAGWIR